MPRRRSAHRRSSAFAQPENNDLVRYWLAQLLSLPAIWRRGHDRRFETFEHPELLACFGIEADEADSFIGSRQHARRNWEVSHVNQFLAAMAQYQGVFIATTNLLERIDAAAMRRFDSTIAFDYLDSAGAMTLFRELATANNIALTDSASTQRLLANMPQLTPGDFAAVHRRLQVRRSTPDSAGLAGLLQTLQQHKPQQSRPIGFGVSL